MPEYPFKSYAMPVRVDDPDFLEKWKLFCEERDRRVQRVLDECLFGGTGAELDALTDEWSDWYRREYAEICGEAKDA